MREPLEVKWTDCGDHWELQIVHQEFLREEFHKINQELSSIEFRFNSNGVKLLSTLFPDVEGSTVYVRGKHSYRDNDVVRIPSRIAALAERAIYEYNNANRWRMEGSQSVVARQSTLDPDWEQRILAKRDALLRDCFS
jgi:hypothetical protein